VRRIICALGLFYALTLPHAAFARSGNPHDERVAKLRERLQEVLHDKPLGRTRVGVVVMQLSDGNVLFEHNPQVPFNPASNTKMLTTAAAMTYLGPGYRYRTALYGPAPDEEGVVHGDVVLRGSGDPSLATKDLAQLAHALAARGVTRIEGDLVADGRFRDVGDGALILNRNTYFVHVRPGDVGHAALVSVQPQSDFFGVENQAKTVIGKRSRLRIDAYRSKDDRLIVTVRGRITENRGEYVDARRLADGALYSAQILRGALRDFGVELTGKARTGHSKVETVLAEHLSAPLADISRVSNKPSNNFVADCIYKTLGGELFGLPGTLEKGTKAVMEYLSEMGIAPNRYKIVNGSGLTHENRITARDLAVLLRHIYRDPQMAPDFVSSLAVSGIDGTIRNRFLGSDAVGLVRAKTGTLSGVSALSGYVGDKDDVIVFTIFVEGFRNRRTTEVRHAQVRMVEAMLRFLRSDAPGPGTKDGKDEAGVDYESSDVDPELTK
jgi:D-alanyl-D-alanine carboxypeptidase/D-alanyl-D-alanine-endopeptidase (penicillin-binding protein 4)